MSFTMDFALVNQTTNIVENVIVLADGVEYTPPSGTILVALVDSFGIGDTWNGNNFVRAPEPQPEIVQPISEGTQTI